MSYIVSARKYRPQTFESVLGQEHVTSTLKNALMADKLAHAFLFCGPRGVGKTTCARLLAKVINMDDPKAALQDGSYAKTDIDVALNIFELDGASNNKVEDIRYLIEQVRFPPQKGKYKVFIIDEVHMLSSSAFNAFLKTLEEPPPYAIFILATTEKHKLLPTILSRCQIYDFKRIGIKDIVAQLVDIAHHESIQVEEEGLLVIAEKADGAMRDALSLFDRIASSTQNQITYESVIQTLNVLDYEHYFKAVEFLMTEDGPSMLLLLEDIMSKGFDADIFMSGLSAHLRNLMYCKQDSTIKLLQVSGRLKEKYLAQASSIDYGTILTCINVLNEADIHYSRAKDQRLHTEIALLKTCYANRAMRGADFIEKKTPELSQASSSPSLVQKATAPIPVSGSVAPPRAADPTITPTAEQQAIAEPWRAAYTAPEAKDVEEPKKISPLPKSTVKPEGGLSALSSLDDLIKSTESKLAANKIEAKELNQIDLQKVWDDYTQQVESITTKNIIANVAIEIIDGTIEIFVPTTVAKEEIHQEVGLFSEVRTFFGRNDLQMTVKVDRDKFPDQQVEMSKQLYTTKEKYEFLVAKNPLLLDFIKTLNLKADQG